MLIKLQSIPVSRDARTYATDVLKNLRGKLLTTTNINALHKELTAINDLKLGDELEVTFEISISKKKKR